MENTNQNVVVLTKTFGSFSSGTKFYIVDDLFTNDDGDLVADCRPQFNPHLAVIIPAEFLDDVKSKTVMVPVINGRERRRRIRRAMLDLRAMQEG